MKNIPDSDSVHQKLTPLLGERMVKTGKAQTFNDVIDDLIEKKSGVQHWKFMTQRLHFVMCLPSGKIVVSNE